MLEKDLSLHKAVSKILQNLQFIEVCFRMSHIHIEANLISKVGFLPFHKNYFSVQPTIRLLKTNRIIF